MSTSELLDQFIIEARDCLEQIGQRLLDVERTPDDTELLNDLFRQVHTLKGNCGLFEFKALERVVHAGEDLLDRVRVGNLSYGPELADALLDAMDFTAELVDAIEAQGALPATADARSHELSGRLRAHLMVSGTTAGTPAPVPAKPEADAGSALPDWVLALPASARASGTTALRYTPEPECFFKGEDPWRLARELPGLQHLQVRSQEAWPAPDQFDCYRCNIVLSAVSSAPAAYLEEHFRYVPEQVQMVTLPSAAAALPAPSALEPTAPVAPPRDTPEAALAANASPSALLLQRAAQVWADQLALLARPSAAAGAVASVREVLGRLLRVMGLDDLLPGLAAVPAGAVPLLAWARAHAPGSRAGAAEQTAAAPGTEPRAQPPGIPDPEATTERGHRVLKVGQDKIDRLMDLIGEMVVAKNALPYLAARAEDVFLQRDLSREIKAQYAVINRIAEDMQHAIMQVRMLPVGTIFQRFTRLVRDTSKRLSKDVRLVIEGEETEADKNVIEALADPLIHLVRNSLDHGIELPAARIAAGKPAQGTIRIQARQESDRVLIEIGDDGAGIDTARVRAKAVERGLIPEDRAALLSEDEAVQLIFLPGFSTAESISDLSGRGVGMDVVRSAVERINGSVQLTSQRGRGATVSLALPLSMAVTNVMMIETAGHRFGVPMDLIVETVRVHADDIHCFKQARATVLRGSIVALRSLHDLLSLDAQPRPNEEGELAVLVVRIGSENVGLVVDDFHGTSDIILKPLDGVLAGLTGFAGTALMGDGSVLMILNPKELF